MQDMMNFWPGPVDICSKKISAYFLFCVESFWDSNSYGEILAPACKWGVVAGSQSSVLTTTLLVMDRVSEGHLVTLIVRDMFFENLLSETHRKRWTLCLKLRLELNQVIILLRQTTFIQRRCTMDDSAQLLRWWVLGRWHPGYSQVTLQQLIIFVQVTWSSQATPGHSLQLIIFTLTASAVLITLSKL